MICHVIDLFVYLNIVAQNVQKKEKSPREDVGYSKLLKLASGTSRHYCR